MNFPFQKPQTVLQPIATIQVSIDSTATSFAEDVCIIEDYMQIESNPYPQRTLNPIPFERSSCMPFVDDCASSASQSQTSSLAEGLYWLNPIC